MLIPRFVASQRWSPPFGRHAGQVVSVSAVAERPHSPCLAAHEQEHDHSQNYSGDDALDEGGLGGGAGLLIVPTRHQPPTPATSVAMSARLRTNHNIAIAQKSRGLSSR